MEKINHDLFAKNAIGFLINHIITFKNGRKYITYGELAKGINYPKPYTGSYFGNNIGKTLGTMGHLFDELSIVDWIGRIPFLQALVVRQDTKLPADGLSEFHPDYRNLSSEKKRDFIKLEYEKIFQFGERWYIVLNALGINNKKYKHKINTRYNPFGSEGSPEHKGLIEHIAANPGFIGLYFKSGLTEYPLKSGDSFDIFFESQNEMIGIEVKSIRSGTDDLERGIYQCIKYREIVKAENIITNKDISVDCFLVYEGEMDKKSINIAKKLNVQVIRVEYNK